MPRRFREILAKNELIRVFCIGRLIDSVVVDMFALAGDFDGFWIDQEHVGVTWKEMQLATIAARANQMEAFVRLAPTGYSAVTQALEAGATGVMAAQVTSAEHAEQFMQWAKFAPRGLRGMNTQGRDANYTHLDQKVYAEKANREHFTAIQIETLGAVNDADKIAAIDGVDLVFLGPADLSQCLGVQGDKHHPKVWEVYSHVADVCRKHGKHWGTVVPDQAFADRAYELGCRMLSFGGDMMAMRMGIAAMKQAFKNHFPAK